MEGVVRTKVGYTGGTKKDPKYTSLGDHSEAIRIEFDPEKTSYEELLALFWKSHNPCARAFSRQYMSAVFYHDETQRKLALETRARVEKERGLAVRTEVLPAGTFTLAEDYHQKFYLRQSPLKNAFGDVYPELKDFVNSTAVMRVNAYLGGDGTRKQLEAEIARLGLSAEEREVLLSRVR